MARRASTCWRAEARRRTAPDGSIAERPSSLLIWLGNLCNLKCRMHGSHFSFEIAAEPARLRLVEFSGGEPLLQQLPHLLQSLLRDGHGAHIALRINTNGTIHAPRIADLLRQFREAHLAVSVDGVGPLQEYIRPPSRWEVVSRNVLAFARDGFHVSIQPIPQACNVFGLLELVQFWEARGIPVGLDHVIRGGHLGLDMLPQPVGG